jgi:hypothetical protein
MDDYDCCHLQIPSNTAKLESFLRYLLELEGLGERALCLFTLQALTTSIQNVRKEGNGLVPLKSKTLDAVLGLYVADITASPPAASGMASNPTSSTSPALR